MSHTITVRQLTHRAALAMLDAAVAEAERLDQPQCIVIVDAAGELLTEVRMTGAKVLSRKSARAKALTAATNNRPSEMIPDHIRPMIAAATHGDITALPGGFPIRLDGERLGGIGVGSGTSEQDVLVAMAGLAAIGASQDF